MTPEIKKTLRLVINIVLGILIAYVVVSWIPPLRNSAIGEILQKITNPVLAPLRSVIPAVGNVDITVIILYFGLSWVKNRFLHVQR